MKESEFDYKEQQENQDNGPPRLARTGYTQMNNKKQLTLELYDKLLVIIIHTLLFCS